MPLAKKIEKKYTYRDYLKWPDDIRCELIDGVMYDMTPAPLEEHQKLSMILSAIIWNFLQRKKCNVYHAPFDVRLADTDKNDNSISTVVQPDIVVICDKKKIDERGCIGAPDFIIEITSPSTAAKDMKQKFDLYEKHGVKEYWIVHPDDKVVMVFKLGKDKKYGRPKNYSTGDTIKIGVLRGLSIDLDEVFRSD